MRPTTLQQGHTFKEFENNKKLWEELIRLLSLHKPTASNLVAMVTMEHKQSKPTAEQGSPNNFEHR
jgi:hypothetical protein